MFEWQKACKSGVLWLIYEYAKQKQFTSGGEKTLLQ